MLGIALLIGINLPTDAQLLHGAADSAALSGVVHWSLGLIGAEIVFAFFCAVGTDAARRVVGVAATAVAAITLTQTALAFGPALGGAGVAAAVFVPAALVEGSALAGMLLGHWYLVSPSLSFRPLRQIINIVFTTLAIEAAVIAVALAVAGGSLRDELLRGAYALPFWLLVIGAGILFTAGILLLTRHFARIRANQPATAMLYALIISVVMGTVPAHLLFFVTGAPL